MKIHTVYLELRIKPALCLHSTNIHPPLSAALISLTKLSYVSKLQSSGLRLERLFHSLWVRSPGELITATSSRPGREGGRTAGKGICTATPCSFGSTCCWGLWHYRLLMVSASLLHMKEHWAALMTAGQPAQLASESQIPGAAYAKLLMSFRYLIRLIDVFIHKNPFTFIFYQLVHSSICTVEFCQS